MKALFSKTEARKGARFSVKTQSGPCDWFYKANFGQSVKHFESSIFQQLLATTATNLVWLFRVPKWYTVLSCSISISPALQCAHKEKYHNLIGKLLWNSVSTFMLPRGQTLSILHTTWAFLFQSSGQIVTFAHKISHNIIVRFAMNHILTPKATLMPRCYVHMQKQTLKGQNVVFGLCHKLGNGTWIARRHMVLWGVWVGVAAYGFSAWQSCTKPTVYAICGCILYAQCIQPQSLMAITIIHTSSDLVSQKTWFHSSMIQSAAVCLPSLKR